MTMMMMINHPCIQASGMPQDSKAAFKAEWEALEVTDHSWALKNSEHEMMTLVEPSPEQLYHQNKPEDN